MTLSGTNSYSSIILTLCPYDPINVEQGNPLDAVTTQASRTQID